MPSVNDKHHQKLEEDAAAYFREAGWMTPPALTYHDVFDAASVLAISRLMDPTSLCIRTRADRVAINTSVGMSMKYEPKTIQGSHVNFACEALPLMHHMKESETGVMCLYPVRRMADGLDCGFVVKPVMEEVAKVFIPNGRFSPEVEFYLRANCERLFPNAVVRGLDNCRGSGDPFVLVNSDDVMSWDDWRTIIDRVGSSVAAAG